MLTSNGGASSGGANGDGGDASPTNGGGASPNACGASPSGGGASPSDGRGANRGASRDDGPSALLPVADGRPLLSMSRRAARDSVALSRSEAAASTAQLARLRQMPRRRLHLRLS